MDICNAIHPQGALKVVFIGVEVDHDFFVKPQNLLDSDLEESFEDKFSVMPWAAIPFSDSECRTTCQQDSSCLSSLMPSLSPLSLIEEA